jgi:uncharacterized protein YciI
MLFAVLFTDKPDHGHLRAANLQAHIDWLERNRDVIPVGGSLRHEPSQTPKGGLWIAQADSKQQLEALLQTDPFIWRDCDKVTRSCIGPKPIAKGKL